MPIRTPIAAVLMLFTLSVSAADLSPYPRGYMLSGTVEQITDGDTANVALSNGNDVVKIRFWGVDTPESRWTRKWPDQPFAKKSAEFTRSMIEGKQVMVRMTGDTTESRHVGEIFVDGKSASRELARVGLAHWYASYARYDTDIQRLAEAAKRAEKGIFSAERWVNPDEWRRMDHGCASRDDC